MGRIRRVAGAAGAGFFSCYGLAIRMRDREPIFHQTRHQVENRLMRPPLAFR
jgi:hypothetical protein